MYKTMVAIAAAVLAIPVFLIAEEKLTTAPDFMLKNYDGTEVKLADYKGKIVVLEWFNYECPFVKYLYEKTGTMKDLYARYKDKNVVRFAINTTGHQEIEKNREFAEKYKIEYPILDDSSGAIGRAYGATNTPHFFIIDAKGNIAYSGAIDNAPLGEVPKGDKYINYVEKALEELTAGKPVSTPMTKAYGCPIKYEK